MTNRERLLNIGDSVTEKFSAADNADTEVTMADSRNDSGVKLNDSKNTSEMISAAQRVFLPTYAPNLILTRSQGSRIWDSDGKEYFDLGAGISVNSLGHKDQDLLHALTEQAGKIWHTTNLYLTEPAIELAEELVKATFADRVFFCNSGAEANEAAIKIARKFSSLNQPTEKREILTFEGSNF